MGKLRGRPDPDCKVEKVPVKVSPREGRGGRGEGDKGGREGRTKPPFDPTLAGRTPRGRIGPRPEVTGHILRFPSRNPSVQGGFRWSNPISEVNIDCQSDPSRFLWYRVV